MTKTPRIKIDKAEAGRTEIDSAEIDRKELDGNRITQINFGDLSPSNFIKNYWQQKPLLLRQAIPDFTPQFSAEELAGLSLEDELPSRLIKERPHPDKASDWQVIHGPLTSEIFSQLPPSHWTLLVQQVDTWVTEVREVLNAFRFLPQWRLEDIMVSYAADQGSVGPHFDYYDVFLLQAQGQRRWKIGQQCDSQSPLQTQCEMRILSEFKQDKEWILEPGDLLYLPAGVAHWGIAEGPCITYSIGFRAPSHAEILLDLSEELASTLDESQRYQDPQDASLADPARIPEEAITQLQQIMEEQLTNKQNLLKWFGQYMTQPMTGIELTDRDPKEPDWNQCYQLDSGCRSAYFDQGTDVFIFINGECFSTKSLLLAQQICSGTDIEPSLLSQAQNKTLVQALFKRGWLVADNA